jgi:hypothetical protein
MIELLQFQSQAGHGVACLLTKEGLHFRLLVKQRVTSLDCD